MKKISLAYSPDTDDAFMVYALMHGKVDPGPYEFSFHKADIQTLNKSAVEGRYDIVAVSVGALPSIMGSYQGIAVGASIGDRFGPAIIANKGSGIANAGGLKGRRVAVPGLHTSAFLAAAHLFGPFEAVHLPFDEIAGAVKDGTVDAGILIHEPQLNAHDKGFAKLGDLGALWFERYHLPLPLGCNAIRRSLGDEDIEALTAIYKESIQYGLGHREETLREASASAVVTLPYELADRYIDQYVNHRSLEIHSDVMDGILKLLSSGAEQGLCPHFDEAALFGPATSVSSIFPAAKSENSADRI